MHKTKNGEKRGGNDAEYRQAQPFIWGSRFLWHPVTVLLAWWALYGRPTWRELVCIIIHDWGYWHCPNMDGPEGELHPEYGAQLAGRWLGPE